MSSPIPSTTLALPLTTFALPLTALSLPLTALLLLLQLSLTGAAWAGQADVLAVDVMCRPAPGGRPASVCQFSVTVKHADAGWDHYANRFEIVSPEGAVIGTRVLRHPHVEEQPFRRSLPRVRIPHTTKRVEVRAGDLEHGLGGKTMEVDVPHRLAPAPEAGDGKESGQESDG